MRNQGQSWIVVHKSSGRPLLLQGSPLLADTQEKAARLLELYIAFNRQSAYLVMQAVEDRATSDS
jgi:hypothetical protein